MHVAIRQIGNSFGVVIPKPVLIEAGLSRETGAELSFDGSVITIKQPKLPTRAGWAEASAAIAAAADDKLLKGCASAGDDKALVW